MSFASSPRFRCLFLLALLTFSVWAPPTSAAAGLDTTFNPALPPPVSSGYGLVSRMEDGTLYLQSPANGALVRVGAAGVVDTGFNPPVSSHGAGGSGYFESVLPLAEGKLAVTGGFYQNNGRSMLTKLSASGAADPSFTPVVPREGVYSSTASLTAGGGFLIQYSGYTMEGGPISGFTVANTNGKVLEGFPVEGENVQLAALPNGQWMATGQSISAGGQPQNVVRYLSDLSRDNAFAAPVFTPSPDYYLEFAARPAGEGYLLAVNGDEAQLAGAPAKNLYRLLSGGGLDPAFTPWSPVPFPDTSLINVTLQDVNAGGKALVSSHWFSQGVSRFKVNVVDSGTGQMDTSFNPVLQFDGLSGYARGKFTPAGVRMDLDGISQVNGQPVPTNSPYATLKADGSVDSFAPFPLFEGPDPLAPGTRTKVVYVARAELPDGSFLVTGSYPEFTHVNGQPAQGIIHVRPDGTVNPDFQVIPGYGDVFFEDLSIAPDGDGAALLIGNFTSINGIARPGVARVLWGTPAGPVEWTGSYGLSNDPAALAGTDSDQDGVADLLELAFRLHPRQADAGTFTSAAGKGLPSGALEGTGAAARLRMTYPRRRDRAALGLTYAPLFSDSLDGSGVAGVEISATPLDATWEVVVAEDPSGPGTTGRRFGQVRLEL